MLRYLISCWRMGMFWSVIVFLIGGICGAYTPSCGDISETDIISVKSWSSCTPVDETDGSLPGCYSGKQQRLVEFASNSSSGVSSGKRPMKCIEYRRCLVSRRRCEGVWSLWKESTCNCLTKSKTQTRYCHIRIQVTALASQEVPSIHCLGSSGRYESNRTSSCKPGKDDCKPTQKKQKTKPTEESTTPAYITSSVTSDSGETPTTNDKSAYTNATTKIFSSNGVAQVVSPTLEPGHYAAIAVGGVLVILVLILVLLLQRRRAKLLEKNERRNSATNSQHTEEMADRSHNDEPCYARNDLYQDSVNEGEMHSSLGNVVVSAHSGEPRSSISQDNPPPLTWVENDEDIYWSIVT